MKNRDISETACNGCKRREVCKYQEEFLNAQDAVNNASISFTHTDTDGKEQCGIKYLTNIEYIEPIKLRCKYAEYPLTPPTGGSGVAIR